MLKGTGTHWRLRSAPKLGEADENALVRLSWRKQGDGTRLL